MPIKVTIVADQDRQAFPVEQFGDALLDVTCFAIADKMLKDYTGGYWEYATISLEIEGEVETAGIMMPRTDGKEVTLTNPFSGESCEADAVTAGAIITTYALVSKLSDAIRKPGFKNDKMVETYDALGDIIYNHLHEINQMKVWYALMD